MLCCAVVFVAAPRFLLSLYTPYDEVIAVGVQLLLVAAAFQVFDGAQVAGMCVLRGAADTRVPMVIAALGYWCVGLPVSYFLAFRHDAGPTGVWIGLSAGLAAVAVLLLGAFGALVLPRMSAVELSCNVAEVMVMNATLPASSSRDPGKCR